MNRDFLTSSKESRRSFYFRLHAVRLRSTKILLQSWRPMFGAHQRPLWDARSTAPIFRQTLAGEFCVSRTCDEVIVHHACRLHERVANGRANEFEAALQQIATHRVGLGGARRHICWCAPSILHGRTPNKSPEVSIECSEFFLHLAESFRVLDRSCDFQ